MWDAHSGRLLRVLRGHSGWVTGVVFVPGSTHVISGAYDSVLRVWDVVSGLQIGTIGEHGGPIASIDLLDRGRALLSTSLDGTVRIWDLDTAQERACLWTTRNGGAVAAGPYVHVSSLDDIDELSVRTASLEAPLALFADLCVRPELVAASVSGKKVPTLTIPMNVAQGRGRTV